VPGFAAQPAGGHPGELLLGLHRTILAKGVNIYVEYFYGRLGGIGASAAASGAVAVMPEASVIHATAKDDAVMVAEAIEPT
jgi:hypothetical protein